MSKGESTNSVRDAEEFMKNESQTKRELYNAWFKNCEAKGNLRKTECYGENELKGKHKNGMNRDKHQSYSSDEKIKISKKSSEEIEAVNAVEIENNRTIELLWKIVTILKKVVIEMCNNSEREIK